MRKFLLIALILLFGFGGPALAFDCAKATTRVETAICASPELKALDDRMAAAYRVLRDRLDEAGRQNLQLSQRLWIGGREGDCQWRESAADLEACILDSTRARLLAFEARHEAGPGLPGELTPLFIARKGTKTSYEINVEVVKFAEPTMPGMALFNAQVDDFLAKVPVDYVVDFDVSGQLEFNMFLTVAYGSPRVISGALGGWSYDGGAHGNPWSYTINVDLEAGRLLVADDLFTTGQLAALADVCRNQIIEQKAADGSATALAEARKDFRSYEESFREIFAGLESWTFHADKVTVNFDPYEVGAYAEGPFECDLPYETLAANSRRPGFFPPE